MLYARSARQSKHRLYSVTLSGTTGKALVPSKNGSLPKTALWVYNAYFSIKVAAALVVGK